MPEALVELIPLALLFFALALVMVSKQLVHAIFDPLIATAGRIPLLGGIISSALSVMVQGIDSALGTAYRKLDALIGASWHLLAVQMDWLWDELKRHANLLAIVSPLLSEALFAIEHLRNLVHGAVHSAEHFLGRIRALEREFHGIEHRVKSLEHDLTKGIGHDLRTAVHETEKEVAHIEHKALPAIRAADAQADTAIGHLYDWIRGKADIIGAGTFVGAVTAVLSLVGLDWLACRSRSNVNGKSGCALWNDLESLLGLAFATLAVADLEQLAKEMQAVEVETTKAIADLVGVGKSLGI